MSRTPKYNLPERWEEVQLGDICELFSKNYEPKPDGKLMYVGLEHIDSGNPHLYNWGIESEVKSAKHRYYSNDILYGKLRPYLDKVVLAEKDGISSSDILIIRAIPKKISSKFLIKILHHERFIHYATQTMTGTTLPRTNWKSLRKFTFYLPKIEEQDEINDILDNIDSLIQTTQRLIEKLTELKKGLMQKLFTEGIGHTEFKETKYGKIPEKWKLIRLGKLMEFKNGINFNKEQKGDNGILTIDVKNMYTDNIGIDNQKLYRVNKKVSKSYLLKDGDILFVRSSLKLEGVGFPNLFIDNEKEPMTYCGFLIRGKIKAEKDVNPKYLVYFLRFPQTHNRLINYSGRVAITNVSQDSLKILPIFLPDIEEQNKIVEILENIDEKITNETIYKKKLNNIKKGLMQVLLTGKKRVQID